MSHSEKLKPDYRREELFQEALACAAEAAEDSEDLKYTVAPFHIPRVGVTPVPPHTQENFQIVRRVREDVAGFIQSLASYAKACGQTLGKEHSDEGAVGPEEGWMRLRRLKRMALPALMDAAQTVLAVMDNPATGSDLGVEPVSAQQALGLLNDVRGDMMPVKKEAQDILLAALYLLAETRPDLCIDDGKLFPMIQQSFLTQQRGR